MNDAMWQRKYSRKGFVTVSAMTAFLAACGGSTTAEEAPPTTPTGGETTGGEAARPQASGTLFYYNWADYVNPETYKRFQEDTGVKVKKDFYASNEDLLAKLQGGARGYDLVVPTGYMAEIMGGEGLLQEIDYSKLPLYENVDDKFRNLPYDPDNKWSVPKDWGTTGYTYRTDLVKEKPTTWREFVELTKGPYSGKVTILDAIPECTGSIAVMLGYSYNTEDEGELEEVRKELLDLKPHILAITSTENRQLLISGRAVMGMTWNGDGAVVIADTKGKAEYVVAEEGGEFWVDTYTIPTGAENPDAAYAWIDYTYEPEIHALEVEYHNYGAVVKKEMLEGVMDPEILANEDIFPPDEIIAKLEAKKPLPEGDPIRDRIWTEFKAA